MFKINIDKFSEKIESFLKQYNATYDKKVIKKMAETVVYDFDESYTDRCIMEGSAGRVIIPSEKICIETCQHLLNSSPQLVPVVPQLIDILNQFTTKDDHIKNLLLSSLDTTSAMLEIDSLGEVV